MRLIPVLLLLTIGGLSIPSTTYAQSAVSQKTVTRFQRFVKRKMKRLKIPGIAVAITEQNQTRFSAGFGVRNVTTGEPVTEDTLFHIGSTHKAITATLIGVLKDEGTLTFSTTSGNYLQGSDIDPFLTGGTIADYLTMTGGFVGADEDNFYDQFGNSPTPENLIDFISSAQFELARRPGVKFVYSNISASLAGYLAVYATGGSTSQLNQSYSDLLHNRLLSPLSMTRSTIFVSEARADSNHAVSHRRNGSEIQVMPTEDYDQDPLAPSGSLKSSANEMAQFLILHAQQGVTANGQRLLEAATMETLWTPNPVSGTERYAMGWDARSIGDTRYLIHTGSFDRFNAIIAVVPDKQLGIVLLANSEQTGKSLTRACKLVIRRVIRGR